MYGVQNLSFSSHLVAKDKILYYMLQTLQHSQKCTRMDMRSDVMLYITCLTLMATLSIYMLVIISKYCKTLCDSVRKPTETLQFLWIGYTMTDSCELFSKLKLINFITQAKGDSAYSATIHLYHFPVSEHQLNLLNIMGIQTFFDNGNLLRHKFYHTYSVNMAIKAWLSKIWGACGFNSSFWIVVGYN